MSVPSPNLPADARSNRIRSRLHGVGTVLKWLLFVAVVVYVCQYACRLWNQAAVQELSWSSRHIGWLGVSALLYLVSWLPSVWFWQALMNSMGGKVSFRDAARAYYCGHLGKYIPGKAMVLVIRSAMVQSRGCRALPAAIAVTYETLTMMDTGLAVGIAFAPLVFANWRSEHSPLRNYSPVFESGILILGMLGIFAGLLRPFSRLLTWIAIKATPGGAAAASDSVAIPARLIAAGCGAFVVSWLVQGLSLGVTLYAISATPFELSQWPLWTGAMALSTALGFAVLFAPGGLGVREGILLGMLSEQAGIGPQAAVAATVLTRVVSLVSEVAVSVVLYLTISSRPRPN